VVYHRYSGEIRARFAIRPRLRASARVTAALFRPSRRLAASASLSTRRCWAWGAVRRPGGGRRVVCACGGGRRLAAPRRQAPRDGTSALSDLSSLDSAGSLGRPAHRAACACGWRVWGAPGPRAAELASFRVGVLRAKDLSLSPSRRSIPFSLIFHLDSLNSLFPFLKDLPPSFVSSPCLLSCFFLSFAGSGAEVAAVLSRSRVIRWPAAAPAPDRAGRYVIAATAAAPEPHRVRPARRIDRAKRGRRGIVGRGARLEGLPASRSSIAPHREPGSEPSRPSPGSLAAIISTTISRRTSSSRPRPSVTAAIHFT